MRTHELKTWPQQFEAIWDGRKRYEVRVNDRDFQVGDRLQLREFDPAAGYSGRVIEVDVTYMTKGGDFGLPANVCVLGLATWLRSAKPAAPTGPLH